MKKHNSRKKANAKKKQMPQQPPKKEHTTPKASITPKPDVYVNFRNTEISMFETMADADANMGAEIIEYHSIITLDCDCELLSMEESARVRDDLFAESKHCITCFISPSGCGITALIATNAKDQGDHALAFMVILDYYSRWIYALLGREVKFDIEYINPKKAVCMSYDPDLYQNLEPLAFDIYAPNERVHFNPNAIPLKV